MLCGLVGMYQHFGETAVFIFRAENFFYPKTEAAGSSETPTPIYQTTWDLTQKKN
jgi:hypothetical protein